jgi:hypothetical protein
MRVRGVVEDEPGHRTTSQEKIAMRTIQQAWHGRWRNVVGAVRSEDEMDGYVARAIERDGYRSFRVADDSTEGERGAPMKPVHAHVPLPPAENSEWMRLVVRSAGQGEPLTSADRARMNELSARMDGEVIGATDHHGTAMEMQRAHEEAKAS